MYLGKTLFAQAMDFLPWKTFHRIVNRYGGDHRRRSPSCAEQFRVIAFAQLTYRESLRDIEVCLAAQAGKLYHMGISAAVARSTLADRRVARLAHLLRVGSTADHQGRALYVDEDFGVELANTVYALDATTIDLCLSMFPWVPFRSTKTAVKLHTLLDLRGSIPTFIHISDGKMHDVNVLDLLLIEASAFYIMDRGYLDFERLYALDQAGGFFITRAKIKHRRPSLGRPRRRTRAAGRGAEARRSSSPLLRAASRARPGFLTFTHSRRDRSDRTSRAASTLSCLRRLGRGLTRTR